MMKKISCYLICLLVFFSVSAVQAAQTVEKTAYLGQYVVNNFRESNGRFVAYDGQCATIQVNGYCYSVLFLVCDKATTLWIAGEIVEVRYDGNSVIHISYQE